MFLSAKYLLLYTGAELFTGFATKGAKGVVLIGMAIAALIGANFGLHYAIISAIEFGVGFAVALLFQNNK